MKNTLQGQSDKNSESNSNSASKSRKGGEYDAYSHDLGQSHGSYDDRDDLSNHSSLIGSPKSNKSSPKSKNGRKSTDPKFLRSSPKAEKLPVIEKGTLQKDGKVVKSRFANN